MKNLFERETVDEVISRIDKLQPAAATPVGQDGRRADDGALFRDARHGFGQAHSAAMFIGRLIGPLVKPIYSNEKPFSRNNPTDKKLVIADQRDFLREQEQLKRSIRQFYEGGEAQCTRHPHPFFGALTPQEWSRGMYKHLDHHLRQFGA